MNKSVLIAAILSVLVVLWIFSGSFGETDNNASSEQADTPATEQATQENFKVTVRDMLATPVQDVITLQGDIEPARAVILKSETQGRVSDIKVEDGQRVRANEILLNISIDDRQARLEQAEAELKLRKAELVAAEQLKTKKMISGNQLEQAVANVAAAQAAVKRIKVEIAQTYVGAAFSGVVNERLVELGDYVSAGDPLAELIDDSHLKIVAQVPQQHIAKIQLGQEVRATLLDGTIITGQLTYISSKADDATRTFKIEAVSKTTNGIRLGQSARVRLTLGEIMAHKVSSSILSLSASGDIFVNAVNDASEVVRYSASIIKNDNDGVWLSGLPEQLKLIVVGQAFVTEGQLVQAVFEDSEDSDAEVVTEPDENNEARDGDELTSDTEARA
jgi:multidrug efflux system membrane fusion protein